MATLAFGHCPGIPCVKRDEADAEALALCDEAKERFQDLLNVFKVFGHHSEYDYVFTASILPILKDGVPDWRTKELLILKTTQENRCHYCLVQHERVAEILDIPAQKVADLMGNRYGTSPFFIDGETALLDFCTQVTADANAVPVDLWTGLRRHWSDAQIVDAAFVISIYTAVSKFAECLGVELEDKFSDAAPKLRIAA